MKVTIKDIAEMAGVSIATVSMVVNSKDGKISEATREKVLKIVDEVGYRPSTFARQMKGKNSKILGLVMPDLRNQYYPELASGFSDKAENAGYQVLLLNSKNKLESEERFARTLISMSAAGIAFCGVDAADLETSHCECSLIRMMQKQGIAVVQLDRYYELSDCSYVGIDNHKAAYDMTEILLNKGYENVTAVEDISMTYIREERIRGYMDAMHAHGHVPTVLKIDHKKYSNIDDELRAFWEKPAEHKNVAIFDAMNDIGAIECMKRLQEHGIRVPEDVGIAGFDDIYVASKVAPSLTTVSQPKYKMGEMAFDILHEMIKSHATSAENVILPCKYIERESTGNLI